MASVFDKIARRACYPVHIGGEVFHLREPLYGDSRRVGKLDTDDRRSGLALALCLVDADGAVLIPQLPEESDAALADRVSVEMSGVPASAIKKLSDALETLIKEPDPETLAKN